MKRLCVCCDGTWNSADRKQGDKPTPTNVLRTAYRIAKRDGAIDQITYYDQGVGTGNAFDRATGGAFGTGLEDNLFDAYRFLIANYEPGDEIFLFGFSRGAFTVRSLAGMIRMCGILKRPNVERYADALKLYQGHQHPDSAGPIAFRTQTSVVGNAEIPIQMIGVWDTVGARGIPLRGLRWTTMRKYQFHDTELSKTVRHGYHALAIDEHRAPFEPTLWANMPKDGQTVEQVWFIGAHSDVGGGYLERSLADISLGWMIEKARVAGLAFDDETLAALPLAPNVLTKPTDSMTGLYNATPGIDRPIGLAATPTGAVAGPDVLDNHQHIHPTVLERWDRDPAYRPKNLRAYFRRKGDPRANG